MAVTQKPISAKINFTTLEELDLECYVSGRARNAVINDAIKFYIEIKDLARSPFKPTPDELANLILKKYIL